MTKILLKKNQRYAICSCGQTKKHPFCDGEHRVYNQKNNTQYKSIKIIPETDVILDFVS